jgi:GNAT superfamily N-acetyltransferase
MTRRTPLVIRQAGVRDIAALARMRCDDSMEDAPQSARSPGSAQAFVEFGEGFAAFVERALASGRWVIWVAEDNGQVVAQLYVQVVEKLPRPGRLVARWGYATAAYSLAAFRNRGNGSLLLRRVAEWAEEQGLEFLLLWPSDRSAPFYERAGFSRSPDALELHLGGSRVHEAPPDR